MIKLKQHQIEFIEQEIRKKGLQYQPLTEDIHDYFCEAIQEYMAEGLKFKDAYRKVLEEFGSVEKIQEETISTINQFTMIKNFIKIAFRNMKREKLYAVINIMGLSIGLASTFLVMLYVHREFSYDNFHQNAANIFRVGQINKVESLEVKEALTPPAIAHQLSEQYSQVISTVRLFSIGLNDGVPVKVGDNQFSEKRATYADSTFFTFFNFNLIYGLPSNVLLEPNSVVLSESTSKKYFADIQSVGKMIEIDDKLYEVTGIMGDMPTNSHFHYDLLMSMSSFNYSRTKKWNPSGIYTYITLAEGSSIENLESSFQSMIKKFYGEQIAADFGLFLQPLLDIHLKSNIDWEVEPNGDINYVWIFAIIGVLVVLIACINFINLTTARSSRRIKEIGVRKALGSNKSSLKWQFVIESVSYSMVSFTVSVILSKLFINYFNYLSGVSMTFSFVDHFWLVSLLFLVSIIIGLLAGSYSSFYLTSYNAIEALKGKTLIGTKNGLFRATLVTFQFIVSTGLIISTLVIYKQLNYMSAKKLGFDKESSVIVSINDLKSDRVETLKKELKKLPAVIETGKSSSLPSTTYAKSELNIKGKGPHKISMYFLFADENYIPSMNINMNKGRNFSREFTSDSTSVIINRAAAMKLGLENPVGEYLEVSWPISGSFKIIGVTEDYNFQSFRNEVEPLVMANHNRWQQHLIIRLHAGDIKRNLETIESIWDQVTSDKLFEYSFLDETFDATFGKERKMGKLFIALTGLAIFIACLGMVVLSYYSIEQRIKEIGVRKVLGATKTNISVILIKEFIKLVVIGYLIAAPTAYFLMTQWLFNFAFRAKMTIDIFLIGGITTLLLSLLTVIYQTMRAANSNPVKTLRYE